MFHDLFVYYGAIIAGELTFVREGDVGVESGSGSSIFVVLIVSAF